MRVLDNQRMLLGTSRRGTGFVIPMSLLYFFVNPLTLLDPVSPTALKKDAKMPNDLDRSYDSPKSD